MVRLRQHELDLAAPPAHAYFLRAAWCPGSGRERVALRLLLAADRLGLLLPPPGSGSAAAGAGEPPSHDEAVEAARACLLAAGRSGPFTSGLSRAPALGGRLVYLWDGEERGERPAAEEEDDDLPPPHAVAKVTRRADLLAVEAGALERLAALPWDVGSVAPAVLARSEGELSVLVEAAAPGVPLLRSMRLHPSPGRWDETTFEQVGRFLGRLHAHAAPPSQRDALRSWVHGGLDPGKVFVRPARASESGRLAAVVGWSRFREDGDAATDLVRFIVSAAAQDLADRGRNAGPLRESADALASWLMTPGSPPFAAVVECMAAWREMIADVAGRVDLRTLLVERFLPELEAGREADVRPRTRDMLAAFVAGPGPLSGRLHRRHRAPSP